jgi:hypothetical protein
MTEIATRPFRRSGVEPYERFRKLIFDVVLTNLPASRQSPIQRMGRRASGVALGRTLPPCKPAAATQGKTRQTPTVLKASSAFSEFGRHRQKQLPVRAGHAFKQFD